MGREVFHPVDVHVGLRLGQIRRARGMSQEVLAGEVGLSVRQIQKYEQGRNRLTASRMYELASILSVPISAWFEGLSVLRRYSPDSRAH